MHTSPTLEGFRAAFRHPTITLAEMAWRWTVGAIAVALLFFSVIEYLDSLPVSSGDAIVLRTKQPVLIARAIGHIIRGTLNRGVLAALVGVLALMSMWIIAASAGRAATVRALLDCFGKGDGSYSDQTSFRSLLGIHFLRVALALGAGFGFVGAAILAGFASPDTNLRPGLVFILLVPLAGLIWLAWYALSWLLSLATVFAIRDGEDTSGSISAAVTLVRKRTGAISAVSTWTGLAHLVAFSVASSAVAFPLAFLQVAPARLRLVIVLLLTLAYFAVVDWLYIARLAGYLCIVEEPYDSASSEPSPVPRPSDQIDRDELILGDIPAHA